MRGDGVDGARSKRAGVFDWTVAQKSYRHLQVQRPPSLPPFFLSAPSLCSSLAVSLRTYVLAEQY
eukprot:6195005-Pleurochrysis_carterae.AAC.3